MNGDHGPVGSLNQLNQRLDIDFALQAAGLGVWELDPVTNQMLWDNQCRQLFGLARENSLPFDRVVSQIHPRDVVRVEAAVQRALRSESEGNFDQTFRTVGANDSVQRWVRLQGRGYYTETGEIYRFAGVAQDVSEHVINLHALAESETQFRNIVEQAPVAIMVVRGDDFVVDQINAPMTEFTGLGQESMGTPLLTLMPELVNEFAWQQVQRVYREGIDFNGNEVLVTHSNAGVISQHYYNLVYRPFRENGLITGVIQVATEITEQVFARKKLEETETRLRGIIAAAPAGIGLFVGRDLIIESANQTFIDIVGKGPGVEGLPLREAMPELLTEGQPFLQILDDVFTKGEPFISPASLVKIVQNGVLKDNYYNISYTPLRNTAGEIYGILDIAIDVTTQVNIQQSLEETESTLRGAIEVADMGIWELNMQTGIARYSERVRQMFEFQEDFVKSEQLYNQILESDRPRLIAAVSNTEQPGSDGMLDQEYTIVTYQTARQRILRAQAKMYFDEEGKPSRLVGSMRDITEQRQTQMALEQLVQQRTEELAVANEELATTNEELASSNDEYAAINDVLEEGNSRLQRSNSDLEIFAYVASHDLQEPLRKIQQFSTLLMSRYADAIGGGVFYVERMQAAAGRMSLLISDLLDFSRISTKRDLSTPVALGDVVSQALSILELRVQETNAHVKVGPLPTIKGDAAQLGQLFQNLLSNAIKFSSVDNAGNVKIPKVIVSSELIKASDMPTAVKFVQPATAYYRIDVSDNGVGFDIKYLDRIFQPFQRLYGKTEFAGTGIGLAICEKVVINHGGAIMATSEPGNGSTFMVYFPA